MAVDMVKELTRYWKSSVAGHRAAEHETAKHWAKHYPTHWPKVKEAVRYVGLFEEKT